MFPVICASTLLLPIPLFLESGGPKEKVIGTFARLTLSLRLTLDQCSTLESIFTLCFDGPAIWNERKARKEARM